jgi:tellurium resistance protein TerZ
MAISLTKGQKISLEKEAGGQLSRVIMGVGWDMVQKSGFGGFFGGGGSDEIDLDASCIMFDVNRQAIDAIWFKQLQSKDGSIVHTGDNRTGAGEGDDEQILVDLSRIPANVKTLMFVVNSFTGQNFNQVDNAFCRVVDQISGKEIARYTLSGQGLHTAQVMAKLYNHNGEWKMQAIGEYGHGKTFMDLMPIMVGYL